MGMNLRIGSAVAALAMALTLGHTNLAFADSEMSLTQDSNYSGFDDSSSAASDDIYAVLSPAARPGGPGGPPPGGGGYYGPGHGGHRPYRGVQCRSINRRGIVFYGQGRNMLEARDNALWNCQRSSRQCWLDGCQQL
jgi:hypothetical protein